MKYLYLLLFVCTLALPAQAAEVTVDFDADFDFSQVKTYAWRDGIEALRSETERWIHEAVERELEARGLRKVEDRRADLYVVTRAIAQTDVGAFNSYANIHDMGVITARVVTSTTGVLNVDLIAHETDLPVWRGMAKEVMGEAKPKKVRRLVDKVTKKMFKELPIE